jgi:hypothetical protein
MIPDCGHIPHVEKPVVVTELILRFLARENVAQKIFRKFSVNLR